LTPARIGVVSATALLVGEMLTFASEEAGVACPMRRPPHDGPHIRQGNRTRLTRVKVAPLTGA